MIQLLSIVIPVRNEAENIRPTLTKLADAVHVPAEILIVYDEESDPTLPVVRAMTPPPTTEYRLVRNTLALRASHGLGQVERALA